MQVPISRDEMRSLKVKKDEEVRLQRIYTIVSKIYDGAINQARASSDYRYKYAMPTSMTTLKPSYMTREIPIQDENVTFHNDNMADILSKLRGLFPDCSVEFKSLTMAMGPDGKMHDISTLDEKALMFIGNRQVNQCITIDWS